VDQNEWCNFITRECILKTILLTDDDIAHIVEWLDYAESGFDSMHGKPSHQSPH